MIFLELSLTFFEIIMEVPPTQTRNKIVAKTINHSLCCSSASKYVPMEVVDSPKREECVKSVFSESVAVLDQPYPCLACYILPRLSIACNVLIETFHLLNPEIP